MPPYIKEHIEAEFEKGEIKTRLMQNNVLISSLIFSKDGKIKDCNDNNVTLFGYLDRIIRYSRKNIEIYLNDILLTDIKPSIIPLLTYEKKDA